MTVPRQTITPRIIRGSQYLEMGAADILTERRIPGAVLTDEPLLGARAIVVQSGEDVSVFIVVPNRPHLTPALFQGAIALAEQARASLA